MTISIEFFGIQRLIARTDRITMPVENNTKAGDALEYVKAIYPELPLDGGTVLITVNQVAVPHDRLLYPNDTVCFIPGIGGG